jgi:hypothetical protein
MPVDVIRFDEGWRLDEGHFMDQPPTAVLSAPTLPRRFKKGKVMDYIPNQRDARYQWYKNFSATVVAETAKFGGVAADATAMKAIVDGICAKYDATTAAQQALDGARLIERSTEAAGLIQLRAKIKNWKTLTGYPASGSEGVLQLKGAESGFDPDTYKPEIKVTALAGGVKVEFKKKGVAAMSIYMRRGTGAWQKLGIDTESPYLDSAPLAQAGVAEVREYKARGILHDVEIGLESDSASATFAG